MDIIEIVKDEFHKRMILEGLDRIERCLEKIEDDEIWRKPNKNSNSIGNLILHLSGNVRQYVISGIGDETDTRERDREFEIESRIERKALLAKIKKTVMEANSVVLGLSQSDLTEKRSAQGYENTILSILIHVIEHFSYHVGQISYYTKLLKDCDMGYYAGEDLNKKSK